MIICLKRNQIILFFCFLVCHAAFSQQPRFSLATDGSILRSFKKGQRYWSFGQTVNFNFHFTAKDGAYAWISYYSDGKFRNELTASAKQSTTTPQQINYHNDAHLRFKHISIGWKKYLKGTFDAEKSWSLYGYAGFGLMMGRIENTQSVPVDSSLYTVPVLSGKANFKRLTFDLGLGCEFPIGADVYLYFETRTLVPTTDYPSHYLFINRKAPLTAALNAGIRLLIN
jgi:hypothetical protein